MAEKDLSEKYLESYNDVFADIVNVLLYQGENVVLEKDLTETNSETHYKTDGKVHQQTRDIVKYWKKGAKIALIGMENQTTIDKDMILRVIGYDGASYRKQLPEKNNKKKKHVIRAEPYPVITIILYFGSQKWNAPKTLHERISIPDSLKPYVSDYHLNIFEIAYLTEEQLQLFQSDFRIVADYFIQTRKNKNYIPSPDIIEHVDAVLQMLHALTGDYRFEETYNQQKGVPTTMCEVLDKVENRGIKKGIKKGIRQGIIALIKTCREFGCSIEDTAQRLSTEFSLSPEAALANVKKYWGK